jgi:hypothetical protein
LADKIKYLASSEPEAIFLERKLEKFLRLEPKI